MTATCGYDYRSACGFVLRNTVADMLSRRLGLPLGPGVVIALTLLVSTVIAVDDATPAASSSADQSLEAPPSPSSEAPPAANDDDDDVITPEEIATLKQFCKRLIDVHLPNFGHK